MAAEPGFGQQMLAQNSSKRYRRSRHEQKAWFGKRSAEGSKKNGSHDNKRQRQNRPVPYCIRQQDESANACANKQQRKPAARDIRDAGMNGEGLCL